MSIAVDSSAAAQAPPREQYPYGWRDVPETNADGTTTWTRIALTLEDALHPQFGDVMPEGTLHAAIRKYLADVFEARLAGIASAVVLSETLIVWDIPDLKNHAPDVGVVFGVKKRKQEWTSFNVAQEQARPRLIVEIVSPNTRTNDVDAKLVEYHRAGVQWYIILDRESLSDPWQLRGYEYTPARFREMPKDERGRLWLEPLGIWIGAKDQRIICYDGTTDEELGDYATLDQALTAERQRAEAEKQRAEAEKQRAEAEKQRAEAEKQRAEAERLRAEAERLRAEAEKQRADAAEARVRELEEQMRAPGAGRGGPA